MVLSEQVGIPYLLRLANYEKGLDKCLSEAYYIDIKKIFV